MDELLESEIVKSDEDSDSYLFQTMYGDIQFVIIDTEMSQLNDFCCLMLKETKAKIQKLQNHLTEYKINPDKIIDKGLGFTQRDLIFSIEGCDMPLWEDTFYFIARANCIMLLQAFLERSLKSLYVYLTDKDFKQKIIKGKSKIESYIITLQNKCSLSFEVEQEVYDLLNETRKIRNTFAHGDWDEVRDIVRHISLQDSFAIVSDLFWTLEYAYEEKRPYLFSPKDGT